MMKKMFCLLALVTLVGTANALTYNWTHLTADGATGTAGRTNTSGTLYSNTKGTYVVLANMTGDIKSGTLIATGNNAMGDGNQFRLGVTNNEWTASCSGLTNVTLNHVLGVDRTVSTGKNILGFSINRVLNVATVEISVNGVVIATAIGTCGGPIGSWAWGENTLGADVYAGASTYDAYLLPAGVAGATNLGAAEIAAEFALVPEPTVLALLALGVAGLTLRRKVL